MGVYIKGMEMPTDCALMLKIFPDGRVGVPVHLTWAGTMVVKDAEAVPVPTPHMDVAIEKVIFERTRQMKLWGEYSDNHPFEWMSILGEEFGELCEAVNETYFKNGIHPECGGNEKIIREAVHVAAVAVAIIESSVRNAASTIIP